MSDARRTVVRGPVIVLRGDDIDTDRIIPARYLKCVTFDGLGEHAFKDDRAQMRDRNETHPFDHPDNAGAKILLVGRNFGCGSSREHAPQALMRWGDGIEAVVGESFAEIFAGNCHALGVPCVTVPPADLARLMDLCEADPTVSMSVDLDARLIRVGDVGVELTIPDGVRQQLLAGSWDSTAELLAGRDAIQRTASALPYLSNWR
jgi:3-isopropylmalate/(R)-2-methylmalate dehydratase small subunit